MTTQLSRADIVQGFEKVGISPLERDIRNLRDLMSQPLMTPKDEKVIYKTVLSNGTASYVNKDSTDAELERDSY